MIPDGPGSPKPPGGPIGPGGLIGPGGPAIVDVEMVALLVLDVALVDVMTSSSFAVLLCTSRFFNGGI